MSLVCRYPPAQSCSDASGVVKIALCQPRGPRDNFAGGLAVAGHFFHLGIHNAEIDQRNGEARSGADFHLVIGLPVKWWALRCANVRSGPVSDMPYPA